jgi:hypothetical protein
MKTLKVLALALVATFVVSSVNAQTTPAKPVARTEKTHKKVHKAAKAKLATDTVAKKK